MGTLADQGREIVQDREGTRSKGKGGREKEGEKDYLHYAAFAKQKSREGGPGGKRGEVEVEEAGGEEGQGVGARVQACIAPEQLPPPRERTSSDIAVLRAQLKQALEDRLFASHLIFSTDFMV